MIRLAAAVSAVLASMAAAAEPATLLLDASAKVLGVSKVKSLQFSGAGSWYQFGQAAVPGGAWPKFDLSRYTVTVNYDTAAARVEQARKQSLEVGRERPVAVEQKADQWVSGNQAWNLGGATGNPQPQPLAVEERQAEIWTTPQGFIKGALANNASVKLLKNGAEISYSVGKSRYVGTLNETHQLVTVKTWIDNPVLGDTPVELRYSGYKDFGGVEFPAHIQRVQGGYPVLDVDVSSVVVNATLDSTVPDAVSKATTPVVAVAVETLAPGVFYLKGGTHHSVAIEQRDHVVVVEAPQNEARSEAVIAKVKELVPGKPIRFVINTHAHFDHSGGLRTYAAEGATIITQKQNLRFYKKAWSASRALNPDRLAKSGKSASVKGFSGKYVLKDADHPVEIYEIAGNGHNDAFALVYLPAEKILVEADAYTPPALDAPPATSINPYTVNLDENVQRLGLSVNKVAALHGTRLVGIDDLRAAAGKESTAAR